jgi:polyhydroxyalkanoate synthesis regulator phasin
MAANTIVKRMLDAGVQFTEMSQSSAEKLVNEFVKAGQLRKKDAEEAVQELVDRGRSSTEHLFALVQSEVAKQLSRFADRVDGVEGRIEELAQSMGVTSKPQAPAKTAPAKKSPAKKAPVKKSAAKKAPAKKAPAESAAPVKHGTGPSGVAKVVATKSSNR